MKKKRTNPYKEANEAFLAEKAKEEGIIVLDNGVMYRKLEERPGEWVAARGRGCGLRKKCYLYRTKPKRNESHETAFFPRGVRVRSHRPFLYILFVYGSQETRTQKHQVGL